MKIIASHQIIRALVILTLSVISSACGGDQNTTPTTPVGMDCTSQTLSWDKNGQSCDAISGIATSGNTVHLIDSIDTFGNANFTCTNGIWGVATTPACAAPILAGNTVTDVQIVNTGADQSNVPITFGQVFAEGDLAISSNSLVGNIGSATIPLQLNAKATHPDGSLRHAVISAVIPAISSGQTLTMSLKKTLSPVANSPSSPADLLNAGFIASINVMIGGVAYTASADSLLAGSYTQWVEGSIANEWEVSAPLHQVSNPSTLHPHLAARFGIRAYGTTSARVEVVVENDWAYEPNPQNFTYDVNFVVNGVTAYSKIGLVHYHHARWRKMAWFGIPPSVDVIPNKSYLIASKAVPNYDQTVSLTTNGINGLCCDAASKWGFNAARTNTNGTYSDSNNRVGPMGQGILNVDMASTGGRSEIGPLTSRGAMYLINSDKRIKDVMLAEGDLAGSWSIHYRDKATGLPLSTDLYPCATLPGNSPSVCVGGPSSISKDWAFPALVTPKTTPMRPDASHEPSLAYLPYLVTGDYYYLEELQFWTIYNWVQKNYGNRTSTLNSAWNGLVRGDQLRGQAWDLRTLGETAYITPDNHPLKSHFKNRLADNLAFYQEVFVSGNPNAFGVLAGVGLPYYYSNAIEYDQQKTFTVSNVGGNLVFNSTSHKLGLSTPIYFQTFTGNTMPTGITASSNVFYYVVANNLTANTFSVSTTVSGAPVAYAAPSSMYVGGSILVPSTGYPPWQDNFFTWSMGHLVELGFTNAAPILQWKAKFPVNMINSTGSGGSGYCFVNAAPYQIQLKNTSTSSLYSTYSEIWDASFRNFVQLDPTKSTYGLSYGSQVNDYGCNSPQVGTWLTQWTGSTIGAGQLSGNSNAPEGYPAQLQIALAAAVDAGIPNAGAAWSIWTSSPKGTATSWPDYSGISSQFQPAEPQFAIVPRN